MEALLGGVDKWFLVLSVLVLGSVVTLLGGYFVASIRALFNDLKESIEELKKLITELFKLRTDHESRIKALEVRIEVCAACNGHEHRHRRITDEDD